MDTARETELSRGSSIVAVGFATTVAMWGVGYVGHLPAVRLPAPWILGLLLLCPVAGGLALARLAARGWRHGALAGALSGLLNLLVLGGLLSGGREGEALPSAAVWLPGSILLAALLAAAGAAAGSGGARDRPRVRNWSAAMVGVAIAAALLLLAVGGLVTSADAGLAVVDWPNTFGYNMFLYPLSRMTGGVYYEHAHRLFGALVGLTTVVLALQIRRTEERRWVRGLAWGLVAAVIAQGILGGLRVTGEFTLAAEPGATRPSLPLAMVHGVLAQLYFAGLVTLGAVSSTAWRDGPPAQPRESYATDRVLGGALLGVLLVQLMLGAAQRHLQSLLLVHAAVGVAFVTPLAVHVGLRAWGLNPGEVRLRRLGLALAAAVGLQLVLGLGAWLATQGGAGGGGASAGSALAVATAHQWFGAVVLGLAVLVFCWNLRRVGPPGQPRDCARPDSSYT